ncbi:MAG: SDR family NAD(P)-dependent oxidoreductase [Candidatus Nitrosocosmicus sp.]
MLSNGNNNRVLVLIGVDNGFGKAIAEDFAKAGYAILLNSLDELELKKIAKDISTTIDNEDRVAYLVGNISDENFSEKLMEEALNRFGSVDVLINNGKVMIEPSKFDSGDKEEEEPNRQASSYFVLEEFEFADARTKGIYQSMRSAVKRMLNSQKRNRSIINISSCQGCIPQFVADSYTASKSGVDPYTDSMAHIETITKSVALELADTGIRVNGIVPGIVDTDINKEISENEQKRNQKIKEIPIKRFAHPQEISKVALFLASEDASYITGAMIPVDGGLMLSRPNFFVEVH